MLSVEIIRREFYPNSSVLRRKAIAFNIAIVLEWPSGLHLARHCIIEQTCTDMSFIQNGQKYSSDFLYEAQLSCLLWHIQSTRSTVLFRTTNHNYFVL